MLGAPAQRNARARALPDITLANAWNSQMSSQIPIFAGLWSLYTSQTNQEESAKHAAI